jgi:hypothetical protein
MIPVRGDVRSWTAAAIALALFAVACSDSNGQGPEGEVSRDLIENASDWEALGITDYSFTATVSCFCAGELFRPATVVVRSGVIESASYVDDGQPVDPVFLPAYQTIDEMFETIANAIQQKAVRLEVTYDPELHYPTDVYIDISEMIADEEQGFTATDLVPIADN